MHASMDCHVTCMWLHEFQDIVKLTVGLRHSWSPYMSRIMPCDFQYSVSRVVVDRNALGVRPELSLRRSAVGTWRRKTGATQSGLLLMSVTARRRQACAFASQSSFSCLRFWWSTRSGDRFLHGPLHVGSMAVSTWSSSRMENETDAVFTRGPMAVSTKDSTRMAKHAPSFLFANEFDRRGKPRTCKNKWKK